MSTRLSLLEIYEGMVRRYTAKELEMLICGISHIKVVLGKTENFKGVDQRYESKSNFKGSKEPLKNILKSLLLRMTY